MSPAQTAEPKSKSTGPRTSEGKQRSAMNATRHGLTGRTVVMPYEDMQAYHAFCKELFDSLAPETPVERQYAQTFCDTQWRLNRARSIEDAMLSLGHFEEAGDIDVDHCQVHAALTAARVFRDDSRSFVNLSLYKQRLQRTLEKSLKQLQTLQAERRALNAAAARQAESGRAEQARLEKEHKTLRNLHEMKPKPADPAGEPAAGEFVFSTSEIEPETLRMPVPEGTQTAGIGDSGATLVPNFPGKVAA